MRNNYSSINVSSGHHRSMTITEQSTPPRLISSTLDDIITLDDAQLEQLLREHRRPNGTIVITTNGGEDLTQEQQKHLGQECHPGPWGTNAELRALIWHRERYRALSRPTRQSPTSVSSMTAAARYTPLAS